MTHNIYGIGTDLLLRKRIESILSDTGERDLFIKNTYTPEEMKLIKSAGNSNHRYATHFCGKEAVFKSLSLDSNIPFKWNQIEILYDEIGVPMVRLKGTIGEIAEQKGISKVLLSLTYDGDYAGAYATSLTSITTSSKS